MKLNHKILSIAGAAGLAFGLTTPMTAAASTTSAGATDSQYSQNWRGDRSADRYDRRGYRSDRRSRPASNRAIAQVNHRMDRLRQDIRYARQSGALNRGDIRAMRGRYDVVERSYRAFGRNGFNRHDIRALNRRIDQVYYELEQRSYRGNRYDRRYDDRRRDDRRYRDRRWDRRY